MLLQRNRGRSDRDAAEGDCPVRSSAETKAAVLRVSVFSRFPPPCLGVRSFPAFVARIGFPSFPAFIACIGLPSSRFRLPAFVFPFSSPAPGRIGSHRIVPRALLRTSAFPRSGKPSLRQSHCAVARLFPNFACLRGASPPLFRGRYAVSHIALLAKKGESPVTDPPPRSIVCAGRITPPAGSRES